jgi:hypothetical protein
MGKGHGERLTRKRSLAIAALLTEPTIVAAAAKVNVHERTLRAWLADPDFLSAFDKAGQAVLTGAKGRLQALTDRAVEVLAKNLDAERPADQLRAVELVLAHVMRLVELTNVLPEIERLQAERAAEKIGGRYG